MHTLTVRFKDSTHHRSYHNDDLSALETLRPIVTEREADIDHVDINPYGMAPIPAGSTVELMLSGRWTGAYTVTAQTGRTPDHLVLINNSNGVFFEHYADPYNIRVI